MKVPPPNRPHKFRDTKCDLTTFIHGGSPAWGRMEVYYKPPADVAGHRNSNRRSSLYIASNLHHFIQTIYQEKWS
jgi:hypothetical protein